MFLRVFAMLTVTKNDWGGLSSALLSGVELRLCHPQLLAIRNCTEYRC